MRPCDSVSGTRCTRCVPPSYLKTENAPSPLTANTTSLNPPASFSLVESVSVLNRRRSAYRVSIRYTSPAQRAASSPPTPGRISTITSFSSAGSFSTSASLSSSSSRATSSSSSDAMPASSGSPRASSRSALARRHSSASRCGASSSFSRRPGRRDLDPVVVHGGIGHALLRLRVGAVELVHEMFDRVHPGDGSPGAAIGSRARACRVNRVTSTRARSHAASRRREPAATPDTALPLAARHRRERARRRLDPARVRRRGILGRSPLRAAPVGPERGPRPARRVRYSSRTPSRRRSS